MRSLESASTIESVSASPSPLVLPRRRFIQGATAMAVFGLLGGRNVRGAEEGNKTELLAEERKHAFYRDPEAWLKEHDADIRRSFDLSNTPVHEVEEDCIDEGIVLKAVEGKRYRRTPGSNILTNEEAHLDGIAEYLRITAVEAHHEVKYCACSHEGCGACKVYIEQEMLTGHADDHGKEEIIDRVKKLQRRGVRAEFGRHILLRDMKRPADRHPAAHAIIDATAGRLHDHRIAGFPDSYVVGSHDAEEISLGLSIVLAVAGGKNGYGAALDKFTFTVVHDPKFPVIAEAAKAAIAEVKKEQELPLEVYWKELPRA